MTRGECQLKPAAETAAISAPARVFLVTDALDEAAILDGHRLKDAKP